MSDEARKGIDLEYATDLIWTMEDRPGFIGLRVDSGDAGTIYFTPGQAKQVVDAFQKHLAGDAVPKFHTNEFTGDTYPSKDAVDEAIKDSDLL